MKNYKLLPVVLLFTLFVSCKKNESTPDPGSLGGSPGNCTTATFAGTYAKGIALTAANTLTVQINVATAGTYTVSTNTVNGVTFSGTGALSTGLQNVTIQGTGTPTNSGAQVYTVTFGNSSCSFTLTYDVTFKATLSGANEVPANASTFTGTCTATFNTTTKVLTAVTIHNVPAPTNGHFHKGAVGVSGPVVLPFLTFTSPINFVSAAPLDATMEADLNANLYYDNIHTAAFPAGEIRGQLIKQ